ncbi:glycosyltransferase family 4 protein [Williamsia phyllosphaerae]|uniref:glycosyltransferase family 4 protein n=1 Tax=Williamsia phyllosphaerae TaxID=885042 RepID=UPI001E4A6906|nr:glycosyltransferase family 4 protein [Williamsia phyllosphaerae]
MRVEQQVVEASLPREVLLLCWRDTDHPQGGGSERYLERVGAELARRGVAVTLRTAGYPGASATEMRDGIRISRGGGRLSVYPRALGAILAGRLGRGPLAGVRPDVVIDTQNGIPFFAAAVTRAPVVVLVHHCHRAQWPVAGRLLGGLGWLIESRISPWVHRRNQYLTVSDPSATDLHALGVEAERVAVVRAGSDPIPAHARPSTTTTPGNRLCVVSRLVPHKQIEDALEVVARLRESRPEIHLDVVGDGWWGERLRVVAADLGIDDHVTFHGYVDETTKHAVLAAADLHLMPSRTEGWGLAVIEAAQHGVPTIGYRSSRGLTDSVVDGVTGVLATDRDDLARVTADLLADHTRRAALGTAGRERVEGYSWSATADAVALVASAAVSGRWIAGPVDSAKLGTSASDTVAS